MESIYDQDWYVERWKMFITNGKVAWRIPPEFCRYYKVGPLPWDDKWRVVGSVPDGVSLGV